MSAPVVSSPPKTRPAKGPRISNWDTLRWFATYDIVVLHTTGGHGAFGWGLPVYLVMTCALAARPGRDVRVEARARARRLWPPWLWGCLLYGLTRTAHALHAGTPPFAWFEPAQLLYGPRVHLWFLPFAWAVGIAVAALAPRLGALGPRWASPLLAGACVGLGWLAPRAPQAWPLSQWTFSLPAVALGLAFGVRLERGDRRPLAACLASLIALVWLDPAGAAVVSRFAGACVLLAVALELPQREPLLLARLTPALLGVYVLHPWVFSELVHDTLWRVGLGGYGWARTGFTFALSLALSLVLGRLWALRRTAYLNAPPARVSTSR